MFAPRNLAVVLAVCALPVMADEMPFQGSTSGSFDDPVTQSVLSFAGTSFGPSLTSGGNFTLTDLGTFTASLSPSGTVHPGGLFNLIVTFTIPNGTPNANYSATVTGTVNGQNANNISIDFSPNGQLVTFNGTDGSGSFFLTVDDIPGFGNGSNTVFQQTLTGAITQAVFTPNSTGQSVPEPTSVLLLTTVIACAGFAMHRRRRTPGSIQ